MKSEDYPQTPDVKMPYRKTYICMLLACFVLLSVGYAAMKQARHQDQMDRVNASAVYSDVHPMTSSDPIRAVIIEAIDASVPSTSTIITLPPSTTVTTADRVVAQSVQKAQPPPTTVAPAAEAPSGEIESLIMAKFGPDHGPKAVQVARCESGLRPDARNGQYRGLFQLGNYHVHRAERLGYSWDQMFQAQPNIDVAYDLFVEQGWRPWSCA